MVVLALTATVISGCASSSAPTDQPSASPTTHSSGPSSKHHRTKHHPKHHHHVASHPVSGGIPSSDFPRAALTPGVVLAAGPAKICVPGYSASVRDVPTSESDAVYRRYDVVHVPYAHEVDHLISLELGGSNAIGNLWPEPYAGRWGARTKDVLENRLHDLVCSGRLPLRCAQHMEATNWVAAYRKYVGTPP